MKITLVANTSWYIHNFRRNLIRSLQKHGHEVSVIAPYDEYVDRLIQMGVKHYDLRLSQRGINPFRELASCFSLFRLLRAIQPEVVLTFTVKCNLYTGICHRLLRFEQVANISGLGEAFDGTGLVRSIVSRLYKFALANSDKVFFQNDEDRQTIIERGLLPAYLCKRIAGSGVDLDAYHPSHPFPKNGVRRFLMFGRLVPQKRYDLFMKVAEAFHNGYKRSAEFWIMGIVDESRAESRQLLKRILCLQERGVVKYLAPCDDVVPVLHAVDVVVLPSEYNEGVPRSLLEAMACGKPVVTTDWKGCRDTVEYGVNGYLIRPGNREELEYYIRKLANISGQRLKQMGQASRRKAQKEFPENRVLDSYLHEVNSCMRPEHVRRQIRATHSSRKENIEQLAPK